MGKGLIYTLIAFGQVAVVLNSFAAVFNARRGEWTIAVLYALIALSLSSASLLAWHCTTRQRPYRWRDERNL